ncbi:hypothetical protein D3C75_448240 [compost metagenome]
MDKMLYIVRGLPGSGKSTLAHTLAESLNAPHVEEDMWLYNTNGTYQWTEDRMRNAITQCIRKCEDHMFVHYPYIVVSNVFEDGQQLEPYRALADEHGYNITYLVVENRRGGINIHNVPNEALCEMRAKFEVSL